MTTDFKDIKWIREYYEAIQDGYVTNNLDEMEKKSLTI